MLGCFLKNDEFGLCDRHALSLEQQVAEILVAAAPSKKSLDVAVDVSRSRYGAPRGIRTPGPLFISQAINFIKSCRGWRKGEENQEDTAK